ncbi:MAG: hypothetical protein IKU24_01940, partial [Clostridia bacterium]|nr:hypothetical protein [Clostridia bacterium]
LYYDPKRVPRLEKIKELCAEERRLAEENFVSPIRVQTVSWKLLLYHASYCEQLAKLLIAKAKGQDYIAIEELEKLADEMGKFEWDIEPYYDHCLACNSLKNITRKPKGIILF